MNRKRLLWVGDAACPSGFARATHEILDVAKHSYDVHVLGINFSGDSSTAAQYDYPIYTCWFGGDGFGIGRIIQICDIVKPDLIVLQNDGWNVPLYTRHLRQFKEYAGVPIVAVVPVDGKNFQGHWLKDVAHAVFWTTFGLAEARAGGYVGPASVIPLGVRREIYRPLDKNVCRRNRGLTSLGDAYIVGNVNRNQPRKRWDLTLRYFAKWIHGDERLELRREEDTVRGDPGTFKVRDAWLYLHVAPTGDMGIQIQQLASYYKILTRLALHEPPVWYGIGEQQMAETYNCFDLAITTTQGEGFGLTTLEAMACGVPVVVPDWSALGEWCAGAAWMVPCKTTEIGPPYVNVIGGVPDEYEFHNALSALYENPDYRETNSKAALERASQERFNWTYIGNTFVDVLNKVLAKPVEVSA
jgi:D-inositol-3-phosphate glycosyltransferase